MELSLYQIDAFSSRGGEVLCEIIGDRVLISGKATKYMEGTITI